MLWNWHKNGREPWKEESKTLSRKGFTHTEIERLIKLRSTRITHEEAVKEYHRLEFVRWLVMNGRLTDHLV